MPCLKQTFTPFFSPPINNTFDAFTFSHSPFTPQSHTAMHDQQQPPPDSFLSPSFNCYSNDQTAEIADRVAGDQSVRHDAVDDDSADFEFVTLQKVADEVFFDGRVRSVYPVFDREILTDDEPCSRGSIVEEDALPLQFSLRELLIREEDEDRADDRDPPSSSSSDADDLESIPPRTYCVWTPKSDQASPSRCEKSNSTGTSSSKKWKLLDLLRRSNSDGKESFVFLTPSASMKKKEVKTEDSKEQWSSGSSQSSKIAGKQKAKGPGNSGHGYKKVSAHEAFYVRNRELKKEDLKKSYLPYKQDLVGFFANVHGFGKPFTSL